MCVKLHKADGLQVGAMGSADYKVLGTCRYMWPRHMQPCRKTRSAWRHACMSWCSRLSVSSYRSTSSMITAHSKYRAHPNVCSPAPLSAVKRTRWPVHCPAVSRRHTWLLQAGQYPRSHRSQATPSSPRTVRGCAAAGPPCSPAAGRCAARTASLLDELCGS